MIHKLYFLQYKIMSLWPCESLTLGCVVLQETHLNIYTRVSLKF